MAFFVAAQASDGRVFSKQTGPSVPANTADRIFVELTEQEYAALGKLTLEQGGGPAYKVENGVVVPRADTRFVARFTLDKTVVAEGEAINVSIAVERADGSPTNFTGARRIGIRTESGQRRVRVPFTGGTFSRSIGFPNSGTYEAFSLEPDVYRVAGDVKWTVDETW